VTLGIGLPGCTGVARPGAAAIALESRVPEERVTSLVRDWFSLLESRSSASRALEALLDPSSFELSLVDGSVRNRGELRDWLGDFRTAHPEVVHQIEAPRISPVGAGLYELRFELDRRAIDDAGFEHLARRDHTWLVRGPPGAAPSIVRIDERALLPFPGTGPRIVCF
jgi:hypothetical protein